MAGGAYFEEGLEVGLVGHAYRFRGEALYGAALLQNIFAGILTIKGDFNKSHAHGRKVQGRRTRLRAADGAAG